MTPPVIQLCCLPLHLIFSMFCALRILSTTFMCACCCLKQSTHSMLLKSSTWKNWRQPVVAAQVRCARWKNLECMPYYNAHTVTFNDCCVIDSNDWSSYIYARLCLSRHRLLGLRCLVMEEGVKVIGAFRYYNIKKPMKKTGWTEHEYCCNSCWWALKKRCSHIWAPLLETTTLWYFSAQNSR